VRNEHSKANEELLAKSLQSPSTGVGERTPVWVSKTSEGARKAWEVRRANGEGAAKPKDEPKADAKPSPKPAPKSTKVPELKLNPAHLSGVNGGGARQAFENAKSRILAAGFKEINHQQANQGEWTNNRHEFAHDDGRKLTVTMDYGPTKNDNRMQVIMAPGAKAPEAPEAPKAEDTAVAHHRQLVHILTQEDVKRQKREPNIHRLSLFFEALDRAKAHPQGLAAGLRESFEDSPLRNRMLRVVEGQAAKDAEDIITDLVAKDSEASRKAWLSRLSAMAPTKPEEPARAKPLRYHIADRILGLGRYGGQPKHKDPLLVGAARAVITPGGKMTPEQQARWREHLQNKELPRDLAEVIRASVIHELIKPVEYDLPLPYAEKDDSDEVKACVRRKIPIIADDHPEMADDQRVAVAFGMCRKDPGVA
jgi:hypothetical protein